MSVINILLNQTIIPNSTTSSTYLDFLLPNLNVSTLIHNSSFTDSLGCYMDFDPVHCNETCGNLTEVLANWPNFYSCAWYPVLADSSNLTTSEASRLEDLGMFEDQRIGEADVISSSVANCLADYCQSSAECTSLDTDNYCSLESLLSGNISGNLLNQSSAFSCMRVGVCSSTSDVNPDIGGLGVILSLIIQYTLSLLGLVAHGAFELRYAIAKRSIRRGSKQETKDKRLLEARKSLDYHLEALTSALVEFQKSQCFFAATLQIAAVIVIPGILGGVQTRDQVLIYVTAANAFSPIMLTLAHIKFLGGRSSWYLLTLSGITFVLGTATYWNSSPTLSGSSADAMFYTNPAVPIMSCGNLAPYAPCYVQNEFFLGELWPAIGGVFYRLPEKTVLAVWITSLVMFLYQAASKMLDIRRNRQRVERHLRDCCDLLEAICDIMITRIKTYKLGKQLSLHVTQLSTQLRVPFILSSTFKSIKQEGFWDRIQIGLGTTALIVQLVTVLEVLVHSSNIISTQMAFGQIVAVGIWIPVLLEYGYLEICGAEEGTDYRLKHPLTVTKDGTAAAKPLPTSTASSSKVAI